MAFYTYILANFPDSPMYIGMTDDLSLRVYEHRTKRRRGFTSRYGIWRLVWYEVYDERENAFRRERRIKEWKRAWKNELVLTMNPGWTDLYETLNQ
jgi:putative endonuclease